MKTTSSSESSGRLDLGHAVTTGSTESITEAAWAAYRANYNNSARGRDVYARAEARLRSGTMALTIPARDLLNLPD